MYKKHLFNTLVLVASIVFTSNCQAEEPKILNVYNWTDYIAPDTIANFEKETGIKVRYDTYESNEGLHAKLLAKMKMITDKLSICSQKQFQMLNTLILVLSR